MINNYNHISAALGDANNYTDLSGLQNIKRLGRDEDGNRTGDEALEAVAKQFESIFLNMMMKSMRDANEVFKDDAMGNSSETEFYEQMFDQQLALSFSQKGVGLAEGLVRQLKAGMSTAEDMVSGAVSSNIPPLSGDAVTPVPRAAESATPANIQNSAQENNQQLNNEPAPVVDDISSAEDFIRTLMPVAERVAGRLGLDARYLLSQAALESGWGQHMIRTGDGDNSFNLFGIKAGAEWQGDVARVSTLEYRNGVALREMANFRSYSSFDHSFEDYANFILGNQRYQRAVEVAADGEQYLRELQAAGYATDPNYASKISSIVERKFSDGNDRG
ncbi:flagellar assembly peptidoglycan hydrolase FlgJ [Pseudomaricurvus alkylphenolicus]|uniref:flagellar assembly peptidoglycan hydrolase FlgJ n=1 Tax=Pseudomaricurvus alkylphenolicus TaxID=1306991 RepID=UPI00141F814A|nr:flagellar assembly peptidoglycan hydrolase FlgJ [Pseudomaricurvus alkylphenolicus]NIB43252.1 flagellar assembly peptidoglycan hydrolase FlgJ [Pseudomaricurvus alkylphenolicus]